MKQYNEFMLENPAIPTKIKILINKFIAVIYGAMLVSFVTLGMEPESDDLTAVQADSLFALAADISQYLHTKNYERSKEDYANLIARTRKAQDEHQGAIKCEIDLLLVRLLSSANEGPEALHIIRDVKNKFCKFTPDWLDLERSIRDPSKDTKERAYEIAEERNQLLPFDINFDRAAALKKAKIAGYKSTGGFLGGRTPVCYFMLTTAKVLEIADLYDRNHYSLASIDICLIGKFICLEEAPKDDSLWLRIARNERKLGHKKLAKIAYFRAVMERPQNREAIQQEYLSSGKKDENDFKTPPAPLNQKDANYISDIYNHNALWPMTIDVQKLTNGSDTTRIEWAGDIFKDQASIYLSRTPYAHLWGIQLSTIPDITQVHLPMPSETFWNEETLYVPKEEVVTK